MTVHEVNFDGLIGPTHNYAGLSYGNLAATGNKGNISNPLEGVLQGIDKMMHVRSLGLVQGLFPPVDRPSLRVLRELGFKGSDEEMLVSAWTTSPELVLNLMSASSMWTANAATVTPFSDSEDGRTHFTAANLAAMYHRSTEHPTTARMLKTIFSDESRFVHHTPLPGGTHMGDEGAANHNRFCADYGEEGLSLYIYGRRAFENTRDLTFPGRQTLEASEAVARQHGAKQALFYRQSAAAINAGAFHNDVVAVCNKNVFFFHEEAFEDKAGLLTAVQKSFPDLEIEFVEVPTAQVSLNDAVKSYLFNSQLICEAGAEKMTLIAPSESAETSSVKAYLEELLDQGGPIGKVDFMDVRQSMRNGGGPACLRQRVVLSDEDLASMTGRVIMDDQLAHDLRAWARRHYRDQLDPKDLGDPLLMRESFTALDELTSLLELGTLYDFQR
ncbi:N-succinylarginine dihydrolase [Temperatibacter marinus]|uniref:N-succinylarginine dihydrolase n=1 Tax=Temperatibacter marinus TaxID=1456591 RepID=A0AA52EG55_9PROT|nr:N-succinylarginine dihydrolase [Temperatibacter marinus]WND01466.1 N-succinylarginine dihydrolase [Temperatibacter marinus]